MYERFDLAGPKAIDLNPENQYYFELFWEVHAFRFTNDNGPAHLQIEQITSWSEFTGRLLSSYEKRLLLDMDKVFIKTWREENALVQESIRTRGKTTKKYE